MRETMLVLHFIGLGMGLGTSMGFMFLGSASAKMVPEEAKKFMLNSSVMSRMGQIGTILLLLTGIYLIIPYWSALLSYPLLIAKLVMVLAIVILLILAAVVTEKIKKGRAELVSRNRALGLAILLLAIAVIVIAVIVFN